jgi:hypothetical protein
MQNESFTITFTGADPDSGSGSLDAWLRLEQPDWPPKGTEGWAAFLLAHGKDPGVPIPAAEYVALWDEWVTECRSDEGGCIVTEIWVHKGPADLQYRLEASHGTLGRRMVEETTHVESVQINLESSYEFRESNVTRIVSASWEGAVYGEDGSVLHKKPSYTFINGVFTFYEIDTSTPLKVFGMLRITYRMGYDKYVLTIPARDEGEYDTQGNEAAYQSTVMAFYDGKVESMDVDLPDLSGTACGNYSQTYMTVDDDDEGDCYKLYLKVHKCTGEEISRELKQVPCPKK